MADASSTETSPSNISHRQTIAAMVQHPVDAGKADLHQAKFDPSWSTYSEDELVNTNAIARMVENAIKNSEAHNPQGTVSKPSKMLDDSGTARRSNKVSVSSPPFAPPMITQGEIDAANALVALSGGPSESRLFSRVKPSFNPHTYPPPQTSDWPTDLTYPLIMGDIKIDRVETFVNVPIDSKTKDAWRDELGWNGVINSTPLVNSYWTTKDRTRWTWSFDFGDWVVGGPESVDLGQPDFIRGFVNGLEGRTFETVNNSYPKKYVGVSVERPHGSRKRKGEVVQTIAGETVGARRRKIGTVDDLKVARTGPLPPLKDRAVAGPPRGQKWRADQQAVESLPVNSITTGEKPKSNIAGPLASSHRHIYSPHHNEELQTTAFTGRANGQEHSLTSGNVATTTQVPVRRSKRESRLSLRSLEANGLIGALPSEHRSPMSQPISRKRKAEAEPDTHTEKQGIVITVKKVRMADKGPSQAARMTTGPTRAAKTGQRKTSSMRDASDRESVTNYNTLAEEAVENSANKDAVHQTYEGASSLRSHEEKSPLLDSTRTKEGTATRHDQTVIAITRRKPGHISQVSGPIIKLTVAETPPTSFHGRKDMIAKLKIELHQKEVELLNRKIRHLEEKISAMAAPMNPRTNVEASEGLERLSPSAKPLRLKVNPPRPQSFSILPE